MIKEFSQIIKIYLIDDIEQVKNGAIIPKQNKKPITLNAMPFDVADNNEETPASDLIRSNVTLYVDKLPNLDREVLTIRRRALVEINTHPGTRIIGAYKYPALVAMTPGLNSDTVTITAAVPATDLIH